MARSSSGFVAGLTAAALAVVGFLTYQASASAPDTLAPPKAGKTPSAAASHSPKDKKDLNAVPAQSGTGERVVYSVGDERVWLIAEGGKAQRTFTVAPSTVDPPAGKYVVTSRSASITGSDGVPIEHVVRFANVNGIAIGFSAAVDGSMPQPDPAKKTGGIREKRADGDAMWEFATIGKKIVVIQ
ncbi:MULTISPECIES: hypothetical protein [unclassified Streptomyces]|uniref:hypothetical protein n=1 Tax=unclassified Streptomyces TaxID=2593676 RepID=UPI0022554273|nr:MULTISPECIES: hypothetical protein [unclassified Streptomyces]MCX5439079.1 hypothetical protein [Streptomyces sp. NBC_00063]WUB94424.1 hypothetical protein OHO83_20105 [Streptomyces sp. NBC_00569]